MTNFISADDPYLTERERRLVSIGQTAIAKEDNTALDDCFADDFVFHGPGGDATYPELKAFFAAMRAAFSDFRCERLTLVSKGDLIAARTTMSGIFENRFDASPIGPVEPTGQPMVLNLINFFRYNSNERIVEEWVQYDVLGFMNELGVKMVPDIGRPDTLR
ncbi:MAG: ester cyclase [Hyphomonas sp.]